MQIRNFNQIEAASASGSAVLPPSEPAQKAASETSPAFTAADEGYARAETELLLARIEHLELVVETARSLMTSNQERLLRRLHDLPHEMMTLTARLARYAPTTQSETTRSMTWRRVQ